MVYCGGPHPISLIAGRVIGRFKEKTTLACLTGGGFFENADRRRSGPRKNAGCIATVHDILDPPLDIHGLPARKAGGDECGRMLPVTRPGIRQPREIAEVVTCLMPGGQLTASFNDEDK